MVYANSDFRNLMCWKYKPNIFQRSSFLTETVTHWLFMLDVIQIECSAAVSSEASIQKKRS